ncbi:Response regulator protein VraR [Microbacterium azadirachtae]|uniref:Response regulator protein VraR n=1 Tax=Microbacterium azadirachtae TaxID=582680 RepID=A0A0F0L217_9MICO|nr:response regulator transcription factor [Microbacterium azadirachtae]KJL27172.1 Response regulator protein VraR [Microbacterium azadirachtae]
MVISIALVNDYEVVVRGLSSMLRAYQNRVRILELDVNRELSQPVDIVLYDTFAATQGDRAELHALAANPLAAKVAVYSWNIDDALVRAALANGAHGYISKGLPARQLVAALEEIHHGSSKIYAALPGTGAVVAGDWPGREEGLTQREAEVLALITQGLSNTEIADRAHLSVNSVKTYIRSCYRRIGVNSRTNAVLWGIEHGFRPDRMRVTNPEPEPGAG